MLLFGLTVCKYKLLCTQPSSSQYFLHEHILSNMSKFNYNYEIRPACKTGKIHIACDIQYRNIGNYFGVNFCNTLTSSTIALKI